MIVPLRTSFAVLVALLGLVGCASGPRPGDGFATALPEQVPAPPPADGAIYHRGYDVPLFQDTVAHRVGDVLTIVLEEKTDAAKSATTTTKKSTSASLAAPTLLGGSLTFHGRNLLDNTLANATTFDGQGASTQSNELTGDVSVTVVRLLAHGNLLVRGEKWITINQGREYVRIQGIVRPVDISPDNTVPSTRVADAVIAYGSKGPLNDVNSKSWLARLFDSPWLPF